MEKIYLYAPQWQDSGLTNELYHGAFALKNYFKKNVTNRIEDILINPGDSLVTENNIYGYSVIKKQLYMISETLKTENPSKIVTLGGGCGVEVPIVSYLNGKYKNLKIFWFDAHGDLNSPESSPSKHFHGMPLRFLTEKQDNGIGRMFNTAHTDQIALIGARDLDRPEEDFILKNKIKNVQINPEMEEKTADIADKSDFSYIHIDLDVLDPKEYKNVKCPVKNGLKISDLEKLLDIIKERSKIIGISFLENLETEPCRIDKLKEIFSRALKI